MTGGLSLNQYTASFWAVRGEQRGLQINYLSATGDSSAPFLRLDTTDPAFVPGLGDLAPGDSVLITLTIDPDNIKISLEPTGLLFGEPAQLQIAYGGAAGDLNGRSEEHTSELQSRLHLVCRLLLEKKKKIPTYIYKTQHP